MLPVYMADMRMHVSFVEIRLCTNAEKCYEWDINILTCTFLVQGDNAAGPSMVPAVEEVVDLTGDEQSEGEVHSVSLASASPESSAPVVGTPEQSSGDPVEPMAVGEYQKVLVCITLY